MRAKIVKFLQNIQDTEDCILWPFAVFQSGYGNAYYDGRKQNAHRVSLILATNEDPPGMDAAHSCRVRLCVNPKHLSWKTRAGNEFDKIRDGVSNRGERHGQAKLTEVQMLSIRDDPRVQRVIAVDYDVTQATISDIKCRRSWASVA